jgi:protocatechuate 3,4-dioxygenase beta subunit
MRRVILIALLLAGCGEKAPERAAKTCAPTRRHPEPRPPRPGMELKATKRNLAAAKVGDPLVVTGVIRGTDCEPLAGGTGRYGPVIKGADRCCWLQATLLTDDEGRYTLDTVFPKGYDTAPPHIHFSFGHPDAEGIVTELVFGGPTARAEYDITLRAR